MFEFSCPCLNVRIQKGHSLLQLDDNGAALFGQVASELAGQHTPLGEVFAKAFAASSNFYLLRTNLFFAGRGSIDADLGAEYLRVRHRQLVGQLTGANVAMYKCVNCNCFTHCVLASPHFKSLESSVTEPVTTTQQQSTVQLDYQNENTNMSGSVESLSQQLMTATTTTTSHVLSSQSSWQTMSSNDTGFADSNSNSANAVNAETAQISMQRVLILSNHMICNQEEMERLRSSAAYSSVFEMVLAESTCLDEARIAENKALNLTFSLSGLGPAESLTSYVERLYKHKSSNEDAAAFKRIFENLVRVYLNVDKTQRPMFSIADSGDEEGLRLRTDPVVALSPLEALVQAEQRKLKKKQRKASFRDDPDSVFELEDMGEGSFSKFNSDENSDENSDDLDDSSAKFGGASPSAVLQKRNSNVGKLAASPAADSPSNKSATLIKQNSIGKKLKPAGKYSFSLPRDIPHMGHRLTMPIASGDSEDEHESGRARKPMMMVGEKENETTGHEDLSFMINDSVNMNDSGEEEEEDDDDELFSSSKTEEELKNMGQAISNLASSIVQKDGRELFGGVPSRRIPINSISKSCFD